MSKKQYHNNVELQPLSEKHKFKNPNEIVLHQLDVSRKLKQDKRKESQF